MTHLVEYFPGACFMFFAAVVLGSCSYDRRKAMRKARADALAEAAAAVKILSDVAYAAGDDTDLSATGRGHRQNRGYYYGRSADIINSIPKDRI